MGSFSWTPLDTWIIVAAMLAAAACALLGNFLLLRRMSMMGDAISHAVLPGLAAAFLLTGTRSSAAMFIGAAVVGIATALFTQWIHRLGRVDEGASMGVVFTALFAVGLIMIVRAADAVDLDPGCVLYGAIELVPLDTTTVVGITVPRAVVNLAAAFLINLLIVILLFKEFRISSFDPALAETLGISARFMHYLLMTLVAVTTVAAFESVGSILVIAMLIVPPAAAHLLTDRLSVMVLLSLLIAALSAGLGHVAAITVPPLFGFPDTGTAGMMAVAAGGFFFIALFVAPRRGIISKTYHRLLLSIRILREDVLGLLYRMEEAGLTGQADTVPALLRTATGSNRITGWVAILSLRRSGRVTCSRDSYTLTPQGRADARKLVRSHRLWESYLMKHFRLPADHVHTPAGRVEHYLTGNMGDAIAEDLHGVRQDPHGRPIPTGKEDSKG